jgi:hypothetical protein
MNKYNVYDHARDAYEGISDRAYYAGLIYSGASATVAGKLYQKYLKRKHPDWSDKKIQRRALAVTLGTFGMGTTISAVTGHKLGNKRAKEIIGDPNFKGYGPNPFKVRMKYNK